MRVALLATCLGTAAALRVANNATVDDSQGSGLKGDNLCMLERLAPKFFLLGVPKGGTTFFFEDFARSDQIVSYEPGTDEPSWHAKEPWTFGFGRFDTSTANKKRWLSHYPNCRQDKHLVAVDCTPGYFSSQQAPFSIHKAYGDAKHQLVFMVFLREPVARSHSHYYQFVENDVFKGHYLECPAQKFPKTFALAVEKRITTGSMCNCACDSIFEDSMYVASFRRYFKNFDPSSFHVVPFKQAVLGEAVKYAWEILNVDEGKGEKNDLVGGGNEQNHHDYPSLDQEMDATLLNRFEDFMDEATGPKAVSNVLAGTGAHLYKFQGSKGELSIATWLAENW